MNYPKAILCNFLITLSIYANFKLPINESTKSYGVLISVESGQQLRNKELKRLSQEYSLKFKTYFQLLGIIEFGLNNPSLGHNKLEAFCFKVSQINDILACELNTKLTLSIFSSNACQLEKMQGFLDANQLSFMEQFNSRINRSNNCSIYPKLNLLNHPPGLSTYWAQEYTGADLLREKLVTLDLDISKNFIHLWDGKVDFHDEKVSNLIMGNTASSLIPTSEKPTIFNVDSNVDIVKEVERAIKSCMEDPKENCPRYINNSTEWRNSELIGEMVTGLVDSHKTIFISSAGNEDSYMSEQKNIAARKDKILLVSSLRPNGNPSSFTNYSHDVSIAAPSDHYIVSSNFNGYAVHFGGTSGAAPQVSAALASFEMITGYSLSTREAKNLLTSTALKFVDIPTPSGAGAGMLNSYFIGEIALKLRERCKSENDVSTCIKKGIKDKETYLIADDSSLLDSLGDYFPTCNLESKEQTRSTKSCREKKKYLSQLRAQAFITRSSKYWRAISCITRLDGYKTNADFYDRLALRLDQSDVDFDRNYFRQPSDELRYTVKYALTSEDIKNKPEFIDKLIETKKFDKEIAQYILSEEFSLDHPEWMNTLIKRGSANWEILSFALSKQHWKGQINWLKEMIKTKKYDKTIAKVVLSKSHWKDHPELVSLLIKQGSANQNVAKYVLSRPYWSKYSELVEELIRSGEAGWELEHYVISQKKLKKRSKLKRMLKKYQSSD